MVWEPQIILLDEPTHGMDYEQKRSFFELINQFRRDGTTVILVTHDIESVLKYADRVVFLSEGHISVEGDPEDVLPQCPEFLPDFFKITSFDEFRSWL